MPSTLTHLLPVDLPRCRAHLDLSLGWQVSWRAVFWGLGLQFVLGLIVIRTEPGFIAFQWLGDQIQVCTWGVAARASWVARGWRRSLCAGGRWPYRGTVTRMVGVCGAPDPWAVGGWAAQQLLPSGLVPPAQTSSPFRGWPDVEENLTTGRFLGHPGPRLVALGPHQERNL